MRSERGIIATLGSVRLALVTGFGMSVLLIVASFCPPSPRGPGALPFHESIRAFFEAPSWSRWWFYLLFVWTALFGLNGLFGTLSTITTRARWRDLRFLGILLMHLGFLIGLGAHLVAGFGTAVEGRVTLSEVATNVAGRPVRIREMTASHNEDGSLRGVVARVEFGDDVRTLGFNDPIFFDGFRRWILVEGPVELDGLPRLVVDGATLLPTEDSFHAAGGRYDILRVSRRGVLLRKDAGAPFWLGVGEAVDGVGLDGFATGEGLGVVVRRNDGLPWVGVASLVFVAGLLGWLKGR